MTANRQAIINKLVRMTPSNQTDKHLKTQYSFDGKMDGMRIYFTEDGGDIKLNFSSRDAPVPGNKVGKTIIREIADGIELTQRFDNGPDDFHKITLVILNPENGKRSFFFYIAHTEPEGMDVPGGNHGHDHAHDHNHAHDHKDDHHGQRPATQTRGSFGTSSIGTRNFEASNRHSLTHEATHGGGRGG